MTETIKQGTWVEIYNVVLKAGERAPQVPEDTRHTALEMRVKGFLNADAVVGQQAVIVTAAGRKLSGKLVMANPAYNHSFGAPIAELSTIGQQLRALLVQQEKRNEP